MVFRIPGTQISFPQTEAQLTATSGSILFYAIVSGKLEAADTEAHTWFADAGATGTYVDPN